MNSCTFIVKILSIQEITYKKDIKHLKVKAQYAKFRKKKKTFDQFEILVWKKKKVEEFLTYYRIGDYIIVGGSLKFERVNNGNKLKKKSKLYLKISCPFWLPTEKSKVSEKSK